MGLQLLNFKNNNLQEKLSAIFTLSIYNMGFREVALVKC